MQNGSKQNLVWLDLEMTGLEPDKDVIVQIAAIVTDRDLNEIAEPVEFTIWHPSETMDRMTPFVRDMHERSGLLRQIQQSKTSLEEAERDTALQRATRVLTKYKEAEATGDDDGMEDVMVEIMFAFQHLPRYQKLIYDLFTVIAFYQKAFTLIREDANLRQVHNACDVAKEHIREFAERRGSRTPPDISKINMN